MNLIEIPLSAIEPDKKNPRKDFGDINALAETFRFNALNPGEPVNPIVTVKDGEIYRIIDGERRYRAMKSIGQQTCHSVVCDDMDEANAMISMLTTDDKQRLTDVERSQGVQQMLLLGVNPEKVEKVGRLGKGGGRRLNKAMILAGEKSEQMTLDHLLAIEEFAGDAEAVERMAKAKDSYQRVASEIRAEREKKAKIDAMREACAAAGITLEEDAPAYSDGYSYKDYCRDPETIAEVYAEQPEGTLAWLNEEAWNWPEVRFYAPRIEEGETPEEAALRERADEMNAAAKAAEEAQREWWVHLVNDPLATPETDSLLIGRFFNAGDWNGKSRRERAVSLLDDGSEAHGVIGGWVAAWMFRNEIKSIVGDMKGYLRGSESSYHAGRAELWLEQLSAMQADGYAPGEADEAVRSVLEKYLSEYVSNLDEEDETEEEEEE